MILAVSDANVKNKPDFWNIGEYVNVYKHNLPNRKLPKKEMAINACIDGKWNYYFGAQVTKLDDIPDGMSGLKIKAGKFLILTFHSNSEDDLLSNMVGKAIWMAEAYCRMYDLSIDNDYQPIEVYDGEEERVSGQEWPEMEIWVRLKD